MRERATMNLKCSKCDSAKIIPLTAVIDQGQASDGTLKARVGYTNPEAWVFKGAVYARLKADICGECGTPSSLPRTRPRYMRHTSRAKIVAHDPLRPVESPAIILEEI